MCTTCKIFAERSGRIARASRLRKITLKIIKVEIILCGEFAKPAVFAAFFCAISLTAVFIKLKIERLRLKRNGLLSERPL